MCKCKKMKAYIAKDRHGTKVFTTEPLYIDDGYGKKEWCGFRCVELENIIPNGLKLKIGDLIEATVELKVNQNETQKSN